MLFSSIRDPKLWIIYPREKDNWIDSGLDQEWDAKQGQRPREDSGDAGSMLVSEKTRPDQGRQLHSTLKNVAEIRTL